MASDFWANYDRLYADKDYASEVAVLEPLLLSPGKLLDVGCGTGEHARHFAHRGFRVVGIDPSREAIQIAWSKRIEGAEFRHAGAEDMGLDEFGAAVSLFNVVNYIQDEDQLQRFFGAISCSLTPGSVFVFDCWNGEAALADPPKVKIRGQSVIVPHLDRVARIAHLTFVSLAEGAEFVHEFNHCLWAIEELQFYLRDAGFGPIRIAPWMKPAEHAAKASWKIMFICKKSH